MADRTRNTTPGGLVPLDKADDYTIAAGNPDPRGWDVLANGAKVGEVDKLIADLSALKVRYLDVELDKKLAGTKDRHVLIPVGTARLDDDNDQVLLDGISSDALVGLPAYSANTPITRDYEDSLRERMTGAPIPTPRAGSDYYAHEHFDENRFFGKRGRTEKATADATTEGKGERGIRIPVTEEEMQVGKRRVDAGEVDVTESVETRRVEHRVNRDKRDLTDEERRAR